MIRKLVIGLSFASTTSSADTVAFNEDVLPILNQYCVMCHLPGAAQADLVLFPDAWSALVGASSIQSELSLVEPGSPDESYMYLKLTDRQGTQEGSGLQMPFQQAPLDPEQIETIRLWIEQGAKKN